MCFWYVLAFAAYCSELKFHWEAFDGVYETKSQHTVSGTPRPAPDDSKKDLHWSPSAGATVASDLTSQILHPETTTTIFPLTLPLLPPALPLHHQVTPPLPNSPFPTALSPYLHQTPDHH